jgi:branched-chain amino acid transport system ATP-binding protein
MGLVTVYSGQVVFQRRDITKKGLGYMPQVGNIFSRLSVEENLKLASHIMGDEAIIQDKLEMVLNLFLRLKGYMPRASGTLSGGERQMLAESMILMRDPKIMLVDEPTVGLMPKLVTDVLRKLKEMAETTGLPVVVVELRARRALELGDYAYMMRGGIGSPSRVTRRSS